MPPQDHRETEAPLGLEPMVWASLSMNMFRRVPLCICIMHLWCVYVYSVYVYVHM